MRGLNLMLSPARDIFDWSRELDNIFENRFAVRGFVPHVDIEENDTHYLLQLDVPGVSKDAIKLEVHDGELIVTGERKFAREEKEKTFHLTERSSGKFERRFSLPENVSTDKVEAVHADGVLTISIPKVEAPKPKQIQIN